MFPTPLQLGLPKKFREWRRNQIKAINDGLDCPKRFIVQMQRQGEGKTATHMSQALIDSNRRYIYLTSTKGLQDQLLADFSGIGLVDIRGKATYNCEGIPGHTCADGSIAKCPYKGSSLCDYNSARHAFASGRIGTTNYSCWIASYKYGQGFGKYDVMICDEAHNIPSEIEKAVNILLGEREICEELKRPWPSDTNDMAEWKQWAKVSRMTADVRLQEAKLEVERAGKVKSIQLAKQVTHYTNILRRLADLAVCNPKDWVVDTWSHGFKFDPIDTSAHTEKLLFRQVEKVIFSSGTFTYRTAESMGIDTSDMAFYDYPSHVNPARSPIMYLPTAKVNRFSADWELKRLVRRIDEIFESRMDRKGIVHTSSYKIRDFIMRHSEYAQRGFYKSNYAQNGDLTSTVIEEFRRMEAPALLVTPSVTTGYDFPYDDCRYQIVAKLNFPYAGSKIEEARMRLDPDRGSAHAVLTLQQSVGRGDRAPDDFQEVFIIDDAFPTLTWKYEKLFSPAFLACVRHVVKLPKAPVLEGVHVTA